MFPFVLLIAVLAHLFEEIIERDLSAFLYSWEFFLLHYLAVSVDILEHYREIRAILITLCGFVSLLCLQEVFSAY